MTIPAIIRASGARFIKTALKPATIEKGKLPIAPSVPAPPPNPVQALHDHSKQLQTAGGQKPPEQLFMPKLGGLGDFVARVAPMVIEDAGTLALRKFLRGGELAASVPAMAEKIHAVHDPEYTPNPDYANTKRLLHIVQKLSSANASTATNQDADNGDSAFKPYEVSKPMTERFGKRNVKNLWDTAGSAFRNPRPDEATSMGLTNFPKIGGLGNLQEEERGGYQDNAHTVPHLNSALAGSGLGVHDNVTKAFDNLRSFLKQDTASFNSTGQESANGPAV